MSLNGHYDADTKVYLLALQTGQKPDNRPDIPVYWQEAVKAVEWDYTRSGGDGQIFRELLASRCQSMPVLAELLAEEPEKPVKPKKKRKVTEVHQTATVTGEAPTITGEVTPEVLCSFTEDDAGNGDAMYVLYGQGFRYCTAYGWLSYTGTHWAVDSDGAEVKKKAVETLRTRRHAAVDMRNEAIIKCTKGDTKSVNGCISRFRSLVTVDIDVFDSDPDALNCANGVVDLRSGTVTPHSPEQYFTYCSPVPYEEAYTPEWTDDYLANNVKGGVEVIEFLQMAAGYSMTGHTKEECLFYLFGPQRSGKGTWSEVFQALLPDPLTAMPDFNTFTAKRNENTNNFDLAPLRPARMIFASESNRYQSLNPAKIKGLTGGDRQAASFKHKDVFYFKPKFKVWMLSNWPVNADPEEDAAWGRVRVIEFPNSYKGREDKGKKERLKSPESLKGILYWAVQGAIKWYASPNGLQTPQVVLDSTKQQQDEQDYIRKWLDECFVLEPSAWTGNDVVHASYTQWCKDLGVQPKDAKKLAQSLKLKGCNPGEIKKVGGKTCRGVKGLKLLPVQSPFVQPNLPENDEKWPNCEEKTAEKRPNSPSYEEALRFYQDFIAVPGQQLRLKEPGIISIGVPEDMDTETFEAISDKVETMKEALLGILAQDG